MELKGRTVDAWGNVVMDAQGLVDHLLSGNELSSDLVALDHPGVRRFNELCRQLDHPQDMVGIYEEPTVSVEQWDEAHQSYWFTPEPWASMDVLGWLVEQCERDDQLTRVAEEWAMFEARQMEPMLRCLIWMIQDFRDRGIVWGVGRGSSVASYVLFLIGVHKVDSMAFDLDINEYLK